MTKVGFVHIPGDALRTLNHGMRAPLVLSRLGTLERTAFSELFLGCCGSFESNLALAAEVLKRTESLKVVISLPLFETTPFEAARCLAITDEDGVGRVSVMIDLAGAPKSLDHAGSLRQADEFVVLMKRFWANEQPITFEGEYYRCADAVLPRKSRRRIEIPVWTSGLSGSAIQFAGRHADVFLLNPASPSDVAIQIERITAARSQFGRPAPRFVLSAANQADTSGDTLGVPQDPAQAAAFFHRYSRVGVTDFGITGLNDRSAIAEFSLRLALPTVHPTREDAGPTLRVVPILPSIR